MFGDCSPVQPGSINEDIAPPETALSGFRSIYRISTSPTNRLSRISQNPRLCLARNSNSFMAMHPLMKSFRKCRIDKMSRQFISKLKQQVTLTPPKILKSEAQQDITMLYSLFGDREGWDDHHILNQSIQLLTFLVLIASFIFYSLAAVFEQIQFEPPFKLLQIVAICVFIGESLSQLTIKRANREGKIINEIADLVHEYFHTSFATDVTVVSILVIDLWIDQRFMDYTRLIILFKAGFCIEYIDIVKNKLCITSQGEQQWGLVIVLMYNFLFAHLLSIVLLQMAGISPDNNWLVKYGLEDAHWTTKFLYAYYWATTIMLTVGFGDFTAVNQYQAGIIILIEMFGCITLSYNINCVGSLMTNLRAQDLEKDKNLRTFNRMNRETGFKDGDISTEIKQYIQKSFQIKKNFSIENEKQTLGILPEKLKIQYLRKVNTKVITNLTFIRSLSRKTQEIMAIKLEKILIHPDQIIIRRSERSKLLILMQGGCVLITQENRKGRTETKTIKQFQKMRHTPGRLLSFNDLLKRRQQKYTIASTGYGILYSMDSDTLLQCMKSSKMDFQKYCRMRDSDSFDSSIAELGCDVCNTELHTEFECPRLHYAPLREITCIKFAKQLMWQQKKRYKINRRDRFQTNWREAVSRNNQLEEANGTNQIYLGSRNNTLVEGMEEPVESRASQKGLGKMKSSYIEDPPIETLSQDRVYNWSIYFTRFNVRFKMFKKVGLRKATVRINSA